ncbi:hypothetical protein OHA03_41155 [Streptomyces sp. NBC_00154]|nr:hypothetical protein [Streptomyces sp. NBC_00154]MCX5317031.1 hypothetical protein [Streptomyces sp. NBC_00154]
MKEHDFGEIGFDRAVQNGPDRADAGGLAGEPSDAPHIASGLADGPLDDMPDPLMVLGGESQVGGQADPVGRRHSGGAGTGPGVDERVDAPADGL